MIRRTKNGVLAVGAFTTVLIVAACSSSTGTEGSTTSSASNTSASATSSTGADSSGRTSSNASGATPAGGTSPAGSAAPSSTSPSGNADAAANAPATITFLTFTSPNLTEQFWNDQVAQIKKKYPNLTVKIEYTPGLDREAYAKQLLAAGNLPDVLWDAPLADFAKADAIVPYTANQLSGIDADATPLAIDGKSYGITVGAQAIPMLYYNADELNKLSIQPPKTYAELLQDADKIKSAGKTPFLVGGGSDAFTSTLLLDGIITTDVYGSDPDWMQKRKAGSVKFSDPLFSNAVTKWQKLVGAGYLNSDALSVNYAQLQTKFQNGEGVFYPMGSWAGAIKTKFKTGVVPFPTDSGDTILGVNFGQALAVSATSKHKAQAQAFAVALATGSGPATAQLQSDSLIPVAKSYTLPTTIAPLIKDTVTAYETSGAKRVLPFGWEQGGAALPSGFTDQFNKDAQKVISGGSVADFVENIDQQYDDLNQQ